MKLSRSPTLAVILGGLLALTAPEQGTSQSTYDDIWKFTEWYRNDQNKTVQSVLFSGRFQYEFAAVMRTRAHSKTGTSDACGLV